MSLRSFARTTAISALSVLAFAGSALAGASTAQAAEARPLFQLPFACGETWRLATYEGHDAYDIDMTATTGATDNRPILASFAGTVVASGWDAGGGGNYVKLRHGNDWETLYLHMRNSPMVSVGQSVRRGQQLGNVGSTGNSTGPHLHYEQRVNGAKTQSYFNGVASGITVDDHSYSVTRTSANCVSGTASVYGVLADNRLTYSPINVSTGVRQATRTSSNALPFTPVAMASLNFNTILLTDAAGKLYRVDVITNSSSLVYNAPIVIGASGWSHDLLAADGAGHLFGIADGTLRRYTITAAKPTAGNITANTVIDSGFMLRTLTAVGPNRILGTTAAGALRSYLINGAGDWDGATLRDSTWTFTHLLSPGGGVYFGRSSASALIQYQDTDPYDGNGDDISNQGTVDASGWTQKLLSAQPATVN